MVNRHWCILCVLYLIIRLGKNSMQTSNTQDLIGQISALSTMCLAFLQHAFRLLWHFCLINYVDVFSIHLISKKTIFFIISFLFSYNFFEFPQICKGIHKLPTHFAVLRKKYFQKSLWNSFTFFSLWELSLFLEGHDTLNQFIDLNFIKLHVGKEKLTEAEQWTIIQCVNKSENGQCKLVLSAVRKHSLMSSLHSVPLICHKAINTKIPEKKSYSSLLFFAVYLHFRNSKSLFLWI